MHPEFRDPRLTAEGELAMVRVALDEGDLAHAAGHLAGAVAHAPTLPEVHEALGQLAARADGGLELFPLEENAYIGAVVARAHLLAAAGRPADAIELLAAATRHDPSQDWAGVPWVADRALPGRVDPERLVGALLTVCGAMGDPTPEEGRGPFRPYLRLALNATEAHPSHAKLHGAASAVARRLGEHRTAIRHATRGVRLAPSKLGEVWLAGAYRAAGRTDDAVAAFRRALEHDPDDLSVYADIASTLGDAGRLDDGLRWAERAAARDATFDCVVHVTQRLRFLRDGDLRHLVALADFDRDNAPARSHEHHELAESCAGKPWLSRLPAPGEAVINVLRQVLAAQGMPDGEVRIGVSDLEPPSAMRTLRAILPRLSVEVAEVRAPDLRLTRRPDGRQLWRYAGTVAEPAVPPPSALAAQRVREVVEVAWPHPPAVYDDTVALASVSLDDLVSLLAHPPSPPDSGPRRAWAAEEPWLWVRAVQVWACLGMLHHGADEPWSTSTRRRALVELVWGVEDWITEAALFALVVAAWVDPAARPDVANVVADRLADADGVRRERVVTVDWSLAHLALATPDLAPAARATAERILAEAVSERPSRRRGWRRWLGRP
jgi:tetratricopeptide (TPR) repeat protein